MYGNIMPYKIQKNHFLQLKISYLNVNRNLLHNLLEKFQDLWYLK